jgi:hypothetical protein
VVSAALLDRSIVGRKVGHPYSRLNPGERCCFTTKGERNA